MSTYATYAGAALLVFGPKLPFSVGATVTIVGAASTYISAVSSISSKFENEVERVHNLINDQKDDPDKINLRLQKYSAYKIKQFNANEWVNSYINKYAKSDVDVIYYCKLKVATF